MCIRDRCPDTPGSFAWLCGDFGGAADAQPAARLIDREGVVRQSAGNLIAAIEQPMSERHFPLLQVSVLNGPDGSSTLAEPLDRRFRDQQGLRQPNRPDIDLCLFAEVEAVGYALERDLY